LKSACIAVVPMSPDEGENIGDIFAFGRIEETF
jgi:hypothetical protein